MGDKPAVDRIYVINLLRKRERRLLLRDRIEAAGLQAPVVYFRAVDALEPEAAQRIWRRVLQGMEGQRIMRLLPRA